MNDGKRTGTPGVPSGSRPVSERLTEGNSRALAKRLFLDPGYEFRPASVRDEVFRTLKTEYPYYGYVDVKVEGAPPFVMFSNNDDRVAQTYFWFGPNAFESLSLRIWRELARRSDRIFDVGAFTGLYALTAASANEDAHVCCFEPVKRIFGRLLVNLKANRRAQGVEAFDVALSDADGAADMNVFGGDMILISGSSLVSKRKKAIAREHVKTMRLDTFVREHGVDGVDLVKIDVEMAEGLVLDGMADTLREHRPNLLVEVLSAYALRDVAEVLSPHGYSFALIDDFSQQTHVNDFGAYERGCNVLFCPVSSDELRSFCRSFGPLPRTGGEDDRRFVLGQQRRQRDQRASARRSQEKDDQSLQRLMREQRLRTALR